MFSRATESRAVITEAVGAVGCGEFGFAKCDARSVEKHLWSVRVYLVLSVLDCELELARILEELRVVVLQIAPLCVFLKRAEYAA